MSNVAQTARVVQMLLDMLDSSDQQIILKQLNTEHGLRQDVARMYSDKELAERYGVNVRTARDWIISGKLKGCQISGRWYSRADWIDGFELRSQKSS